MEKTIREIADSLGIDKQKVYRYIKKNRITEALQKNGMMYYDEAAQTNIKKGLLEFVPHQGSASNDAVFDVVMKQFDALQNELKALYGQLETKDKQIAELTRLLDQQQQLQLVEQKKVLLLEGNTEKRGFFSRIFKPDKQ